MTRARAQWRTAAGWRDYDRANYWVLVGLFGAFVVWLLWQQTHPMAPADAALDDAPVRLQRLPSTNPPVGPSAGSPASAVPLVLRVVGVKLVAEGAVPDAAARQALRDAAEVAFGPGQLDDRLSVDAAADPMAWRDHLPDILRTLRATGGEAALRVEGKHITLAGEVPQDQTRTARELMVHNWFGRNVQVDNRLRLSAAGAAAPPAAPATLPTALPAASGAAAGKAPATVDPACAALSSGVAVRFHPNAPALTDEGRRSLRELMPCLAEGRWRVGVHTDSNGDAAANQALTQGRADAVVAYLVGRKLPAERLVAQGFGSSRPVAGNDTPEDRVKNRRVTFEREP